ncbi:MAG: DUF6069 family protein [Halovenus sp.]
MSATDTQTSRPIDIQTLAVKGAVAVVLSALANATLLWAVLATDIVEPFMALSYPPVLFLTVVGAIGATVIYGVLTRRIGDPDRTFERLAAVVLVVSFVPDLGILAFDEAATVGAVAVLMVMHVTVAAVCVAVLTRL